MYRVIILACVCFGLSMCGCGSKAGNEVPTGLAPPTAAEEKAMEDYDAAQQTDPNTGQPVGN